MKMRNERGFTLLEILVSLFIFTILAVMLASALHNMIGTQARTEKNAERLRNLQMALLVFSRDVEQAVDRPIINASGKEEAAFTGSPRGFTFTHTGLSNTGSQVARSNLQRTRYDWESDSLWRRVWPVLDQAASTTFISRKLLATVTNAHFQYLDKDKRFHDNWPLSQSGQPLPRAVKIELTLSEWGSINQLYVIPVQPKNQPAKTPPQPAPPKS